MHLFRPLVAGERFAAHGLDVGLAERVVTPRDEGDGNFAPFGVAFADHHGVAAPRIRQENAFDLGRIYVLAAGFDHVLRPVDEIVAAVRVAAKEVAHAEPAVLEIARIGRLRIPITAEHGRPAHCGLARIAVRDILAIRIDQAKVAKPTLSLRQACWELAWRDKRSRSWRQPG